MMKLRAEKTKRGMLHLVSNKTLLYQMINSKQFKIRNKKFVTFQAAVRMKRLKDNRREKQHIEAINRQNLPLDMIKLQLLGSLAQSRHTSWSMCSNHNPCSCPTYSHYKRKRLTTMNMIQKQDIFKHSGRIKNIRRKVAWIRTRKRISSKSWPQINKFPKISWKNLSLRLNHCSQDFSILKSSLWKKR